MSKNTKDSLNYTKYKTICVLPEEILEAYYDKMTIEKIDELYGKVKQMFLELPEEDAQQQIEQMGHFLQTVLEGKKEIWKNKIIVESQKKRPRLKAKCSNCQHTTYLQFTDGYYCPNCKTVHVNHLDETKQKLKEMLIKLQYPSKLAENEEMHIIQEMLKLDSESAQLYLRLGDCCRMQQADNENALEYCKKALTFNDKDGAIYASMGVSYLNLEDYEQAVLHLEKAFNLWKKNEYSDWYSSNLFANYAISLQKTGNPKKAFELFKMAREAGYPVYNSLVENYGIGKEIYESEIRERMEAAILIYSENLKIDINTLKRVRKYFKVPQDVKLYGFFDYTIFGSNKEGIAVASDGIYFKTLMLKVHCVKWYELFRFDMEYKNCIQLKEKKGSGETIEICFQTLTDAVTFMEVLKEMQNL